MTPHIVIDNGTFLLVVPFNRQAQRMLKAIPLNERRFTATKKWKIVNNEHNLEVCKRILKEVFHLERPPIFDRNGDIYATDRLALDMTSKYTMLGLDESATREDIKRAYRQRVMNLHPDKSEADRDFFLRVTKAYNTLKDPLKRKRYDVARSLAGTGMLEQAVGLRLRTKDIKR